MCHPVQIRMPAPHMATVITTVLTKRSIMSAILQTAGPVAITNSVRQNRKVYRNIASEQFFEAAGELQIMGLGTLVSLAAKGTNSAQVFIKTPPAEVDLILSVNSDLCSASTYAARYNLPSPKSSISFSLRGKLVAMKLVSQKHFM